MHVQVVFIFGKNSGGSVRLTEIGASCWGNEWTWFERMSSTLLPAVRLVRVKQTQHDLIDD